MIAKAYAHMLPADSNLIMDGSDAAVLLIVVYHEHDEDTTLRVWEAGSHLSLG